MKRVFAVFAVLILLSACVSGDYYTNSLTFIRRWNAMDEIKDNESLKIDEDTLWHENSGDFIRYAVWLEDNAYLLVLMCDSKTDSLHACSMTVVCDSKGKISEGNSAKFYSLLSMMLRAMCNMDMAGAETLLEQGDFKSAKAARYFEQDFFTYSLISDDLGATFRIENQRLSHKQIPELTLTRNEE